MRGCLSNVRLSNVLLSLGGAGKPSPQVLSAATLLCLTFIATPLQAESFMVELGGGAGICGARGSADCERAETGLSLDLRGNWAFHDNWAVGLSGNWQSLAVSTGDPGWLLGVGPEFIGRLQPASMVDLEAGLRWGVHVLGGLANGGIGWGTATLRLGGRYRFQTAWRLGLDYALTRPARTEICVDERCADAELALLHQVGLVVGARF